VTKVSIRSRMRFWPYSFYDKPANKKIVLKLNQTMELLLGGNRIRRGASRPYRWRICKVGIIHLS
jgi:hypothetical protein